MVAYDQNGALVGKNGLLPADQYLKNIKKWNQGKIWTMFKRAPTLIWLLDYEDNIDTILEYFALSGLCLSALVFVIGGANIPIMLTLWSLYFSIVTVGQRWYMFGEVVFFSTGSTYRFFMELFSLNK